MAAFDRSPTDLRALVRRVADEVSPLLPGDDRPGGGASFQVRIPCAVALPGEPDGARSSSARSASA